MSYLDIFLDGVLVNSEHYSSFDGADLTLRNEDEEGRIAFSYAAEVEFYDDAYDLINQKLILDPNARQNRITVKVVDNCCNITIFEGEIRADTIKWCENECFIKATFVESNEKTAAYNCLASTLIYDNRLNFQSLFHPFVRHCVEMRPNEIQELFLIFCLLLNLLWLIFFPLALIISIIITIINAISDAIYALSLGSVDLGHIDFGGNGNFITWFINFRVKMNDTIIGCGKGHTAPLIRDYLVNVCTICNLTVDSSIFLDPNSPYYNAMLFNADVNEGQFDYQNFDNDNKPAWVGVTFLDMLKKTFNAEWRVINGNILRFERKDSFYSNAILLDITTYPEDEIISLCYDYTTENQPAYGDFQFSGDGVDWVGNEAKGYYNDIIDFNQPFGSYPNLKGAKQVVVPFGASRFRQDPIDRDVLTDWQNLWLIGSILFHEEYKHLLLLPVHLCFVPKILIWDGTSDRTNAQVVKTPVPGGWDYQQQMRFKETQATKELYQNFWYIEDPRLSYKFGRNYTLTIRKTCELEAITTLDKSIKLKYGLGTINEITINEKTITFKGKV